jgi:hypothetical protein
MPGDFTISRVDGRYHIGARPAYLYVIKVFPNALCVTAYDGVNVMTFDRTNHDALRAFARDPNKVLIGFDSYEHGDCLLREVVRDAEFRYDQVLDLDRLLSIDLKRMTKEQRATRYKAVVPAKNPWAFSIDLHKVTNSIASLHEHGCRLGLPTVIECGYPRNRPLSDDEKRSLSHYNQLDLKILAAVFEQSHEYINIRAQLAQSYGLPPLVFCQGNAQLAETLMLSELRRLTGRTRFDLQKLAAASGNNRVASFPIAELLPAEISFSTPAFRDVFESLTRGTIERNDDGGLDLVTEMPGNTAVIHGLTLKFGCGGLHSQDEPGRFHSDAETDLVDVDAAAYYPSLMVRYGIFPAHILPVFLDVLRAVRDRRLEAKANGDALVDAALKIVVNSLFGKLGSPYSPLHDARACMQVTLTGQVLQLTMIEAMHLAGARPLSANTDGILFSVPKTVRAAFDQALLDWQEQHGLALEAKPYRVYARSSINDYLALGTEVGRDGQVTLKVKARGMYNPSSPKASARVIRLAVSHELRTGESLEAFISRHEHAADFLFFLHRDDPLKHFERDGQRLPGTVRWYATNRLDGRPISVVHSTKSTRSDIEHAQRSQLALGLPTGFSVADLPGLDRSYYIAQARALMDAALMGAEVDQGTAEARALQAQGIVLLPRQGTKNPRGVSLRDAEALLALQDCRSADWGAVTGPDFDLLVLDLDKPHRLDPQFLAIIQQYRTLTSWHGDGSAAAVRSGQKRGALYFWYSGSDARIRTRADRDFLQQYGIEVAYGGKVQAVVGRHRVARDRYVQEGTIVEAPAELIDFLALRLGLPGTRRPPTEEPAEEQVMPLLRQAADATFGTNWSRYFRTRGGFHGVQGVTPGHTRPLRLWLRDGRVCGFTFHASFPLRANLGLVQQEFDDLCIAAGIDASPPSPDEVAHLDPSSATPPLSPEQATEASSCAEAFARPERHKIIGAVMGAGKTHQAAVECLDRHQRGERTLVLVADKVAIAQQMVYITKEAERRGLDPSTLMVQSITSARSQDSSDDSNNVVDDSGRGRGTRIKKGTLIVVSHHHYGSRRGVTCDLYDVVHWAVEHRAEVIVDEAHLFIARQNIALSLDARYGLHGGPDAEWLRRTHCPSSTGRFGCKKCRLRSGGKIRDSITHKEYQTPVSVPRSQFDQLTPEEFAIAPESLPVERVIDLPNLTMRVSVLVQSPGYLQCRTFTKPDDPEDRPQEADARQRMLAYLRDVIDSSFNPVLIEPFAVDEHGRLVEDDPLVLATKPAPGATAIDGTSTAGWRFPYFPCRTRTVLAFDMIAAYYLMQHASKTIWLSGTMGDQDLAYLRACAGGEPVTRIDVPEPVRKPLEKVIIIGHHAPIGLSDPLSERVADALGCTTAKGVSNRTTIERVCNALMAAGKPPVVFAGTKEEAVTLWGRIREYGWGFFHEGEYRVHAERMMSEVEVTNGSMGFLTYGRSAVGTGANLDNYQVAIIDGTVRKPHFVFDPQHKTEAEFLAAQHAERVRIAMQNGGRILRGTGVKFMLMIGLSEAEILSYADAVGRLAQAPTDVYFATDAPEVVLVGLVTSVRAGKLDIEDLPPPKGKARNQQSRKERAAADAKDGKMPRAVARFQRAKSRLEVLAREGKSWREADRIVNVTRRFNEVERILLEQMFREVGGSGVRRMNY